MFERARIGFDGHFYLIHFFPIHFTVLKTVAFENKMLQVERGVSRKSVTYYLNGPVCEKYSEKFPKTNRC